MKFLDRLDKFFVFLGMGALFTIMIIIACDGLGRQLFHTPIPGAYTLIEQYLMVAMIFPIIGYTWSQKGHIAMMLFVTKMPNAVRNILYLCTVVIAFALFGIIAYMGFNNTWTAIINHKMTSGLVRWPLWLSYIWMLIGGVAFCLRMVGELTVGISRIAKEGLSCTPLNEAPTEHDGNSD